MGNSPFVYSTDFPREANNDFCKEEIRILRDLLQRAGLDVIENSAVEGMLAA
ncbi:MAG: hypothetical protein QGI09_04770 [Dehalococcoidia bacterium]|nr:hypothetical protein [Dehalococcoidia bacterium]